MDSSEAVVQAGRIKDDAKVLPAVEDEALDFHAAEVKYHQTCYRYYASKTNAATIQNRHHSRRWDDLDTVAASQSGQRAFYTAFSALETLECSHHFLSLCEELVC